MAKKTKDEKAAEVEAKETKKKTAKKADKKAEKKTTTTKAKKTVKKKDAPAKKTVKKVAQKTTKATKKAEVTSEAFLTMEVDEQQFATVWFSTPGKSVNLLSPRMLDELEKVLDELVERLDIQGVVFASKKDDNFIAGADLTVAVEDGFSIEKAVAFGDRGRQLFQRVAELKVPTVAAIHGTCLGGGTELALACDYRVASNADKTRIGLPEVQLGILPGWGGSQRLPRLIALPDALDMMLTGKRLKSSKALKVGLVDLTPPIEKLFSTAKKLIADLLQGKSPTSKKSSDLVTQTLTRVQAGRNLIFKKARENVLKKTKGMYPAPLKIIDVVQKGIELPLGEAFQLEKNAFKELLHRVETHNLMNLFFISQELGQIPEAEEKSLKAAKVSQLGVLGAGVMGAGIAQAANFKGIKVRLKDVNNKALLKGMQSIQDNYNSLMKRRRLKPKQVQDFMRNVSATTDYSGLKHADMVLEAIVEKMDVKKAVFQELENHVNENTVFATNTSALSVDEMAKITKRPDRFVGLHFFNPVRKMPLVEVVRGEKTSLETLVTAIGFVMRLGKTPIIVKDSPGFIVNRVLGIYGNEAQLILEEGSNITVIDQVMKDFGMPMGFFTMVDMAGIDIGYHAGQTMLKMFSSRKMKQSQVLEKLYNDGRYGQKTGKGFYLYKGKNTIPDHRYIENVVKEINSEPRRDISSEEIRNRLLLIMINEGALCLEEGIVESPGDIDMGMIMGTGFPPFRGGLLKLVDHMGIQHVVDQLERYSDKFGPRFKPCKLLKNMAKKNEKFYPLL